MSSMSTDEVIEKMKSIVIDNNEMLTIHDVCRKFDRNIDEAKIIMNKFANEYKQSLSIDYYLHWIEPATENSITIERFLLISDENELNDYIESNANKKLNHHVYCIRNRQHQSNGPEFVFDKYIYDISEVDIETIQKPTYIRNNLIKYRPNRRQVMKNNHSIYSKSNDDYTSIKKRQQQVEDEPKLEKNDKNEKKYKRIKIEDENDVLLKDEDDELFNNLLQNDNEKLSVKQEPKESPPKKQCDKVRNILKTQKQSCITNFFKKK